MTDQLSSYLTQQWQTLHNSHEEYEKYALIIKLFALALTALGLILSFAKIELLIMLAILWLQEGIWKTFQRRLGKQLEKIEQALMDTSHYEDKISTATLYSQWHKTRPSTMGLIKEYIKKSLKPTVVYPHLLLLVIVLFY